MIGGVAVCLVGLKHVISNSFEIRSLGFERLRILSRGYKKSIIGASQIPYKNVLELCKFVCEQLHIRDSLSNIENSGSVVQD
jgi:hypothetical protein